MGCPVAADPKKPYGDVAYADPGYQADGKKRYPLDSEDHCKAAWSYISQKANAAKYTAPQLAKVKARIKSALTKYGVTVSTDTQGGRSMTPFARTFALDSIEISRTAGDGREVTAYAAVFDTPTEIQDGFGHYREVISRSAFDKTIRERGADRVSVMYNHALTEYGTPSELGSVPVARCLEIRADGRGLLTRSRYNHGQLADAVLESIKNGEIRGQSFRGRILQSTPSVKAPRVRRGGELPTLTRTEIALTEYGPTRTPYYEAAEILAVRAAGPVSASLALEIGADPQAVLDALRNWAAPAPDEEPEEEDTATGDPAGEQEPPEHSRRIAVARAKLAADLALMGVL